MKSVMIRAAMMAATLACGCLAAAPADNVVDAGTNNSGSSAISPPTISVPVSTSGQTVAVRGISQGSSQVVVQVSPGVNLIATVLPLDGSFCVDAPLALAEPNSMRAVAVAKGALSQPALFTVLQSDGAALPQNPTCTVGGPPPPPLACDGCTEDAYQPNFQAFDAPVLRRMVSYDNLQLCPCNKSTDWFAFTVAAGAPINVVAVYDKTGGFDLDIALYRAADVLPTLSGNSPIHSMAGVSGAQSTRSISWSATEGGTYYVNVSGLNPTAPGKYSLVTQ
jgi:hypothetical protein